jgi:deoxyribose-phosphate aldolase
VANGADEVDMVISRGKFLEGEYNFVFDEIAAIKEACGEARLKVIQTGELVYDKIRRASIAMYAGADLLRHQPEDISGGNHAGNLVMLEAIEILL